MLSTEFFFKKWKYRLLLKGICKKKIFFFLAHPQYLGVKFFIKKAQNTVSLVFLVQFWWSWSQNGGSWGHEIYCINLHVPNLKKNSVVNKLYFSIFLSNKIHSQWHLLPGYKQEYQIYRSIYQSACGTT